MPHGMKITLVQLLLYFLLPQLSLSWTCFSPPHLLPTRRDCAALLIGLEYLSTRPPDAGIKRWSRHLPTTPNTENLPRLYYIVDEEEAPATCAVIVDVAEGRDTSVVDVFGLVDVVRVAKVVYRECLHRRNEVGLEFPGEHGVAAKLVRVDGPDILGRMRGGQGGAKRVGVGIFPK
ncbi:MAG: hypothetical protein Q9219_007554 [cf. Caloplaca sp. 3 TL-2023]